MKLGSGKLLVKRLNISGRESASSKKNRIVIVDRTRPEKYCKYTFPLIICK